MAFRMRAAVAALLVLTLRLALAQPASPPPDQGMTFLFQAIEKAATDGQPDAYLQLVAPDADRAAASAFAQAQFGRPSSRATLRERDRVPLHGAPPGDGFRLAVEILFETGNRGRLATWQIDVRREAGSWRIANQRQLSSLDNLYRLALDTSRQLSGRGLAIQAPDLRIDLEHGAGFTADAGDGVTALVLVGQGEMTFTPADPTERQQVAIFSGAAALRAKFDACVLRLNPGDLANHLPRRPSEEPVDRRALERAEQAFAAASRFYAIDLGDVSPGPWSIQPPHGDFVADVSTKRFGPLTYSRSMDEPEDIALLDRLHRRYVALYPSKEKLAARGRFFTDDERADYEALHYDVNASFLPEREWIEGRTRMVLRVRASSLSALQVRLADPLAVRSVALESQGRVLAVRARGRNALLVTLAEPLAHGAVVALTIAYAGRLPPQTNQPEGGGSEGPRQVAVDPSYLYSASIPWYPQPPVIGFATATLRLTVPAQYSCVASGALVSASPVGPASPANSTSTTSPAGPRTEFVFEAARPLRYLACLIGRLTRVAKTTVPLAGLIRPPVQSIPERATHGPAIIVTSPDFDAPGSGLLPLAWPPISSEALTIVANREEQHSAEVANEAQDIVRFYTSLLGDCPYPELTVAVIERDLPGGHSPAYLAILDRQSPTSRLVWRDDPASFHDFPEFFVAHEIAHQWWGQAIGVKNYHEEWLSEGFAQYFAALYAEHAHGSRVFGDLIRQMQHWTMADSSAGPVYLGDRIGQLKNDARALRAIVYDKGALVLHMLRRLVGDQAFFDGLRRYYGTWRFRKAGSDDLREALEAESHVPLKRFFERWVYSDGLPRLKFSWHAEHGASGADQVVVRFEQVGDVFDVPVTVTINCDGRPPVDVVVPVTDRVVERRIPASGRVRKVTANGDDLAPAKIDR